MASHDVERLRLRAEKSPEALKVVGEEVVFGAVCTVLEARSDTAGSFTRHWFDPEHGFLPRKTES